jgi:hypothetical protein
MQISWKCLSLATILAAMAPAAGGPGNARAEVNVNINPGQPPIVASEPPAVVMIPQSRVFFVPDPVSKCSSSGGTGGRPEDRRIQGAVLRRPVGGR